MPSWQALLIRGLCRITMKRQLTHLPQTPQASVPRIRRTFERADPLNVRFTRGLRIVPVDVAGVRGEWVLPLGYREPFDRVLLYAHGGGYVACSPLTYRRFTTALARRSGIPVFVVDYRRAPEDRFPAALDDLIAAYDALRRRIPAHSIALAGDSSGGGLALAAVLALHARRASEAPVAGVVAFSPWTDLLVTGASIVANARAEDVLVSASMASTALNYVQEHQRRAPLASPLYGDLSIFPPTLLFASTTEVLRDDAVRFADRARERGAPVELVLEPSLPHVWPVFFDVMPEARRAVDRTVTFLEQILNPATATSHPSPVRR